MLRKLPGFPSVTRPRKRLMLGIAINALGLACLATQFVGSAAAMAAP